MSLDARIESVAKEEAGEYDLTGKEIEQPGVPPIKAYELDLERGGSVELYDMSYVTGTVDVYAEDSGEGSEAVYEAEESFQMVEDLFAEAIQASRESTGYSGEEKFLEDIDDGAGCVEIWEKISDERRDD